MGAESACEVRAAGVNGEADEGSWRPLPVRSGVAAPRIIIGP